MKIKTITCLLIFAAVIASFLLFSGCIEERTGEPRVSEPNRIGEFTFIKEDGSLQMQLGLLDENSAPVASSGRVEIVIKDKYNNVVYRNEFNVGQTDFKTYERVLTGAKFLGYLYIIPSNEIKKGFSDSGTAYLNFTWNGKMLSATSEYVFILKLSDEEIKTYFENKYSKSAITLESTQRKGNFEVTLVRYGFYTHLRYDTWGDEATEFRVDLKVKNIGSEKDSFGTYDAVVLSGSNQYERSFDSKLESSDIYPGVVKEGYLIFKDVPKTLTGPIKIIAGTAYGPSFLKITYEFNVQI